jgi:hypothetical protein
VLPFCFLLFLKNQLWGERIKIQGWKE